ncbi:hypothetical protein [Nonomuraea coxensis]|uniref:hypothetical protein n=1 Tax=Nonomuraea coxensis TaxID=404386 RepID=UPI000371B4EB|nr:hypothetical protein [Nonomuraea coxensis]
MTVVVETLQGAGSALNGGEPAYAFAGLQGREGVVALAAGGALGDRGDPRWQGIGVIVSTFLGIFGIISTVWVSRKTVEREKAARSPAAPDVAPGAARASRAGRIAARVAGTILVWVTT